MIPYVHQSISAADIDAVVNVLKSEWLTQGPTVRRFEEELASYCGANYAVAVTNGTSGLHLACQSFGLGPGDLLWTSPNTFVASANCARYCGADVDFVDIDARTYNMSVVALEEKLALAKRNGRLPKAVVVVHFAGQSCDMAAIAELAHEYGFYVIEDAAHAVGGEYDGEKVGSCRFSDLTVFSFHPVKVMTTGEGGMVLTNRKDFYNRLLNLRNHGVTRDPREMSGEEGHGPWYYEQLALGHNYRMTDIQAALGLSQLERLDVFVEERSELAQRYNEAFTDLPITTPWQRSNVRSAWHLYVVRLRLDKLKRSRREIFESLHRAGIGVNVHYIPVHLHPYYRKLGFRDGDFPEAERYYQEAITLPLFPAMTGAEQEYVAKGLKEALLN